MMNHGKRNLKKTGNEIEFRLDKNTDPVPSWIHTKENYANKFAGKHLSARPLLNGYPMCQRYHFKGHCFSDCINAMSHIPSKSLNEK